MEDKELAKLSVSDCEFEDRKQDEPIENESKEQDSCNSANNLEGDVPEIGKTGDTLISNSKSSSTDENITTFEISNKNESVVELKGEFDHKYENEVNPSIQSDDLQINDPKADIKLNADFKDLNLNEKVEDESSNNRDIEERNHSADTIDEKPSEKPKTNHPENHSSETAKPGNKIDKSKSNDYKSDRNKRFAQAKEINNRHNEKKAKKCEIIDVYESMELTLDSNEEGVEGKMKFFKNYLSENEAKDLYDSLAKDLPWQLKEGTNKAGEKYPEPRMTHWFGKAYKYSNVTWEENTEWHPKINDLRTAICTDSNFASEPGRELNSVMCNYYRDNNDSIGWHADDETSLGRCPKIASISLGQERVFELCKREEYYSRKERDKFKTDDQPFAGCTKLYRFHLGSGSLVIMEGSVQDNWLHQVPKEEAPMSGRINLTFRYIVEHDEELKEIEHKKKRAKDRRRRELAKPYQAPRHDYGNSRWHEGGYNQDRRWRDDYHVRHRYYDDHYNYDYHYYNEPYGGGSNYRGEDVAYSRDRYGNQWYPRFRQQAQVPPRYAESRPQRQRSKSHNDSEEINKKAFEDYIRFKETHK